MNNILRLEIPLRISDPKTYLAYIQAIRVPREIMFIMMDKFSRYVTCWHWDPLDNNTLGYYHTKSGKQKLIRHMFGDRYKFYVLPNGNCHGEFRIYYIGGILCRIGKFNNGIRIGYEEGYNGLTGGIAFQKCHPTLEEIMLSDTYKKNIDSSIKQV